MPGACTPCCCSSALAGVTVSTAACCAWISARTSVLMRCRCSVSDSSVGPWVGGKPEAAADDEDVDAQVDGQYELRVGAF